MIAIVPVDKIPKSDEIQDVPIATPGEVLQAYKRCLELQELCESFGGIGIAAVQAGIPWKLFLVKSDGTNDFAPRGKYGYFVNCEYEPTTDCQRIVSLEGCLSLRSPDGRLRHFQVERWNNVRILGHCIDDNNKLIIKKVNFEIGIAKQSVVFQHEIDHGKGVLISDNGKELYLWK